MKSGRFFYTVTWLAVSILLIFPIFPQAQTSKTYVNTSKGKRLELASLELEVFRRVNETRAENGLPKLAWNSQAAGIARLHSTNMADFNFFSHTGRDGKRVDQRADAVGLSRWQLIGENIAYNAGFDDPVERAVIGWMNSTGHRRNILRDAWKETGIGIAVTPQGKFFITQVFLKR